MSQVTHRANLKPSFLAFALYLLLFSGFAEFHAYQHNELGQTDCVIGLWIQHGQTAVLALVLVSTALTFIYEFNPFGKSLGINPLRSTVSLRAPPAPFL